MLGPKSIPTRAVPRSEAPRPEALARIGVARGLFVAPADIDVLNSVVLVLLWDAGGMPAP